MIIFSNIYSRFIIHFSCHKYFYSFFFIFIVNSIILYGQPTSNLNSDKTFKHQISFRHDNDFLTFTDRYYSSGLFLSYSTRLEQRIFNSENEQLTFTLGQEIYTPSNTKTRNISELDRPYAGFLALTFGWSYSKSMNNLETDLLVGIAGKASGAGGFHRWYHNALDVPNPPTWVYEIASSFHVNLYTSYTREWQLISGNFGVYVAVQPKLAFGTKDIYAQPELITFFGKRNSTSNSIAYNRIGSRVRELFFALRIGYRFIGHNALLEGHLFSDNSTYLVKPNASIFFAGFDLQNRSGQNNYWVGYRFNSAETAQTKSHKYIILSYARSF